MSLLVPPPGGFQTLYGDPPWPENGGGKVKRGADRHYRTMKVADIIALPVSAVAAETAHLWLWVTNNYLEAGLEAMRAWGFRYVTKVTWIKIDRNAPPPDKFGLGQYARGMTEDCLLGVRGKYFRRGWTTTALFAPPSRIHSRKPAEMRERVSRVSRGPFLELFATEPAPTEEWTMIGRSVTDRDIREDLALLTPPGAVPAPPLRRPRPKRLDASLFPPEFED